MTERLHLDPRRQSLNTKFWFQDEPDKNIFKVHMTVGFTIEGELAELFLDAGKSGSDNQATMHDAAVLLSLVLQHGVTPEKIMGSLLTRDMLPASPVGQALAEAMIVRDELREKANAIR